MTDDDELFSNLAREMRGDHALEVVNELRRLYTDYMTGPGLKSLPAKLKAFEGAELIDPSQAEAAAYSAVSADGILVAVGVLLARRDVT